MAIISTYEYAGTGARREFQVSERILSESHCVVWIDDTQLPSTQWDNYGSIVLIDNAPSSGTIVRIYISDDGTFPVEYTSPSDIQIVASNIDEVYDVSQNIGSVITAADGMDHIIAIEPYVDEISTVAGSIGNVNILADNIEDAIDIQDDIITVAGIHEDVSVVASIAEDVVTVNELSEDITTLSVQSGNISIIGNDLANEYEYIADYGSITEPVEGDEQDQSYIISLVENLQTYIDAIDSADSASASASSASTSAYNASESESNASDSAEDAATSESNAATSASNASTSESNAATSASNASSSESNASDSENAASASASAASTSEANAGTSETNASTYASNASSSASSAASSAATATDKAEEASLSADYAETSAISASVSESNASNSASGASTSASNASASASSASTSASNAATSASNADSFKVQAGSYASAASTSASNASSAKIAAEAARDQTLDAFDSFDDRYLGSKASDPAFDNDGDALVSGALYYNSTDEAMKVYEGTMWVAAYASLSGALLKSNNLTDVDSAELSRTNLDVGTREENANYIGEIVKDMTGFPNREETAYSFNPATRVFLLSLTGSSSTIYYRGKQLTISSNLSITIANTSGGRYIRLNPDTLVLEEVANHPNIEEDILVGYVYYDATTSTAPIIGDERHSSKRDTTWHRYQHLTRGAIWRAGGAIGYTLDDDTDIAITMEGLILADEDLEHNIFDGTGGAQYEQDFNSGEYPVLYVNANGTISELPASTTPPHADGGRAFINPVVAGVGSLVEVANNKYITYWMVATNDSVTPVKFIMGSTGHVNIGEAEAEAYRDYGLPFPEIAPMYKLILLVSDSYDGNDAHVRIASVTRLEEQFANDTTAFSATNHNSLLGRTLADQHTIGSITSLQDELDGKEPADATILKSADIGVSLQAYNVNTVIDASYVHINGADYATAAQGANAVTAYGWGNHASAGYLTGYIETDPIYTASSWYSTTNNSGNWDSAYSWGDHELAGYIVDADGFSLDLGGL